MGLYPPANINPRLNTPSGGYNVCAEFRHDSPGTFQLLLWHQSPQQSLQLFWPCGPQPNGKLKEIKIKWPPGAHMCALYLFTGENGLVDPPCF